MSRGKNKERGRRETVCSRWGDKTRVHASTGSTMSETVEEVSLWQELNYHQSLYMLKNKNRKLYFKHLVF